MARLALHLPVFVASPSDCATERKIVVEDLKARASRDSRQGLLTEPFLYEEHARPTLRRPQASGNDALELAELIVVVFAGSLGTPATAHFEETGTQEELRRAAEQVRLGRSDDLWVYFQNLPAGGDQERERVRRYRERLEGTKEITVWGYSDAQHFRSLFSAHFDSWIQERWCALPAICGFTLKHSWPSGAPPQFRGENIVGPMLESFPLGRDPGLQDHLAGRALAAMQGEAHDPHQIPFSTEELDRVSLDLRRLFVASKENGAPAGPLVIENDRAHFASPAWVAFFAAIGAIEAVNADAPELLSKGPLSNLVHQLIRPLAANRAHGMSEVLRAWILADQHRTSVLPVARNFAAYTLGNLNAREAAGDLARALKEDDGWDVRRYCVTSLGKLRARRHVPDLIRMFHQLEDDDGLRMLIGQALCRIVGVAAFEL